MEQNEPEIIKLLRFRHKQYRAKVIRNFMEYAGYKRAVCFSCGNAAEALLEAGVDVLHIGERGVLKPQKWWQQADIRKWFADCFDATSGHLPISLMTEIGKYYNDVLNLDAMQEPIYLPTGSGETLVCLKLARPDKRFVAVYNLDGSATAYDKEAPLNGLVSLLASEIIFADERPDIIFE